METSSYQALKDFITNKLRKVEGPLPKNKIIEEIQNTNTLISALKPDMFANLLSIKNFDIPEEDDWQRLERELETHFDVKMEYGILIQGDEQRERDTSWWTLIQKQKSRSYYWGRFKEYLDKSLPPEVIKTLDIDTDIVMNNIENPVISSFSRY